MMVHGWLPCFIYVFNYIICMLTWLDLMLLFLWYTCLRLNEHVLVVGMVLLNVHKGFKWKSILIEMSVSLAWFKTLCAYDLILSTSGVVTSFSPFPQHFRSQSSNALWDDFEFLNYPSGYVLTFGGRCQYRAYEVVLVLSILYSFPFNLSMDCIAYMLLFYIDAWVMPNLL